MLEKSPHATQFDWNLCIICQAFTDERLQCPANETHRRKDIGSGYDTISENLKEFSRHGDNTHALSTYIKQFCVKSRESGINRVSYILLRSLRD